MKRFFSFFAALVACLPLLAQKPAITHDVYDKWQTVRELDAPDEGSTLFYRVVPQEGDALLCIYNPFTGQEWQIERAYGQQISAANNKVLAGVKAFYQQTRKARIKKKKAEQMPTDTLVLLDLSNGGRTVFPDLKDFKTPATLGKWAAFTTKPAVKDDAKGKAAKDKSAIDSSKVEKKDMAKEKKEAPKDNLYVLNIATGSVDTLLKVENYAFSKDGRWLAYTRKFVAAKKPSKKDSTKKGKDGKDAKDGKEINPKDTVDTPAGLYLYDLEAKKEFIVMEGPKGSTFTLPKFSAQGEMAFIANTDTTKAGKNDLKIYICNPAFRINSKDEAWLNNLLIISDSITNAGIGRHVHYYANQNIPQGKEFDSAREFEASRKDMKTEANEAARGKYAKDKQVRFDMQPLLISKNAPLQWSGSGKRLFFGIAPAPREKDTSIVEFERAKLDIWAWDADYIPTIQNNRKAMIARTSFSCYMNMDGGKCGKFIQLGDSDISSVRPENYGDADYAFIASRAPYVIQTQWDYDAPADEYVIDIRTGERRMLYCKANKTMSTSPDGRYALIYDDIKADYSMYELASGKSWNLTKDLGVLFYEKGHDTPNLPSSAGRAFWFSDSKKALIADQNDIWLVSTDENQKAVCVTSSYGKDNNIKFTAVNIYKNDRFIPEADVMSGMAVSSMFDAARPVYLASYNEVNKQNGFYSVTLPANPFSGKYAAPAEIIDAPYTFAMPVFAIADKGKAAKLFFTKGNFNNPMNVWSCDASVVARNNEKYAVINGKQMAAAKQISHINPWQKDYNWGSVELIHWTTMDDIKADGLLFKPENFDPNKKYPVIFYFYEKNSQTMYNYRSPAPSASTVNIPFFVSNGYIVCVPDLYYNVGIPGKSCMRSLMPCVDMLEQYPWIDKDNMAVQGQSWGGYQVAYIITQTNRFKAAGAGAPVSNMTSAYSGIRWGSGVTRQAQYEDGQSRIGYNLWDGLPLYMDNSPLFRLPNVQTPVLIMHNDQDGAVPWWQGIEMFNGLRRLGKQAWMLQYNDEDHNLVHRRNRKDLSIRLEQFFNHFLKGEPMPSWMKHGRPVVDKDYDMGYRFE